MLADRSENGNGISSRSQRSGIVPDFVFSVIPNRRERRRLRNHQVARIGIGLATTQIFDKSKDLAGQRVVLLIVDLREGVKGDPQPAI